MRTNCLHLHRGGTTFRTLQTNEQMIGTNDWKSGLCENFSWDSKYVLYQFEWHSLSNLSIATPLWKFSERIPGYSKLLSKDIQFECCTRNDFKIHEIKYGIHVIEKYHNISQCLMKHNYHLHSLHCIFSSKNQGEDCTIY